MKIIKDLTTKPAAVLKFLQNEIAQEGRPPTIREIGTRFSFKSTGTTRDYLCNLAKKGYIKLTPKKSRSIELVKPITFRIPLLGEITAGIPDLAWEEIDEFFTLDEFLPNQERPIFALRIKGDSLIEKGIHEGDIAIIEQTHLAQDGQIVAALIDQEATVKILKKKGTQYYLKPANSRYNDIHKPFKIIGKVTAIIKRF